MKIQEIQAATNAQDALNHIKNGGRVLIPTYTRATIITQKTVEKFEKAGVWLLKDDADGRGMRLKNGKGSVYLFKGQVKKVQ